MGGIFASRALNPAVVPVAVKLTGIVYETLKS